MTAAEPKRLARALYKLLSRSVLTAPARTGHTLPSLIHSPEHATPPGERLFSLALKAAALAARSEITGFRPELPDSALYARFPGEHYRLLKALAILLQPESIVEIGTFTGMGSFALKQADHGVIHTFDVVAWNAFDSHLVEADFADGRLVQHLADLADGAAFAAYRPLLDTASLIFLDGPKDGVFEARLLEHMTTLRPYPGRLLMIDDIRFVNMIDNWAAIASPKIDLTSFGHWSGTGLVDLSGPLQLT